MKILGAHGSSFITNLFNRLVTHFHKEAAKPALATSGRINQLLASSVFQPTTIGAISEQYLKKQLLCNELQFFKNL